MILLSNYIIKMLFEGLLLNIIVVIHLLESQLMIILSGVWLSFWKRVIQLTERSQLIITF